MLSDNERRILQEMADRFAAEDAELARSLVELKPSSHRSGEVRDILTVLVGSLLAVASLLMALLFFVHLLGPLVIGGSFAS